MNERKGFFQRAADRLRNNNKKPEQQRPTPEMVERGPEQHVDDGLLHISNNEKRRGG